MEFSVLISSYRKDDPDDLKLALKSIWDDQTLKPAEIVIVKDGPLTPELDAVIDGFSENAPVKIVPLSQNQGLGKALAVGVTHCSFNCIARMDGDDISLPDRFEKQINFMTQHPETAICGGMIREFVNSPENITAERQLPLADADIRTFCKWRSPFNHVTVMFKKDAILDAGNYQHFPSYEDYWLWARVLQHGNISANLPDILVLVRAGEDMLNRRRGWRFFIAEIKLAKDLRSVGILSFFEMCRNMLLRAAARLMPGRVLGWIYAKFCRNK